MKHWNLLRFAIILEVSLFGTSCVKTKDTGEKNIHEIHLFPTGGGPGEGLAEIWLNREADVYVRELYRLENVGLYERRFRFNLEKKIFDRIIGSLTVVASLRDGTYSRAADPLELHETSNNLYLRKKDGNEMVITKGMEPENSLAEGAIRLLREACSSRTSETNMIFQNYPVKSWEPEGFVSQEHITHLYNQAQGGK